MLGRYSRSQPFFCLFVQNGCAGRSKDKERQKPIKPGEGHGQTTFVVWSIWFLVRVVEKGGFCQERKVSIWKEMRSQIMEWHGNYPSSPGICGAFVCLFVCFFQNHCNCPTVEAGGREFIQRPHGEAEISVQMPDPGITIKLHFIVICVWGLNFSNVIEFYLKEMFTLNVYYSREKLCLKLYGSTFTYYGRRSGTSKTSNSIPIKM